MSLSLCMPQNRQSTWQAELAALSSLLQDTILWPIAQRSRGALWGALACSPPSDIGAGQSEAKGRASSDGFSEYATWSKHTSTTSTVQQRRRALASDCFRAPAAHRSKHQGGRCTLPTMVRRLLHCTENGRLTPLLLMRRRRPSYLRGCLNMLLTC